MVHLHLVSAEIGSGQPCTFHFQLDQANGQFARLDVCVPRQLGADGAIDIGGTFARARAELVTTLLNALIDASHLDDTLTPRERQDLPNGSAVIDLRQPANDHHAIALKKRRRNSGG